MGKKKKKLTFRQNKFAEFVAQGNSLVDSYCRSYNATNMKRVTASNKGWELSQRDDIQERIKEVQDELKVALTYTLEISTDKDLKLINRYEKYLMVLEDEESTPEEVERASLILSHIGSSGYGNAQTRLSKQWGLLKKNNEQKNQPTFQMFDARQVHLSNNEEDNTDFIDE